MNKECFIKACQSFLNAGFNVIPLHGASKGGKTPLIDWTPYQTKKATIKEVYEWANLSDDLNIGIVAGQTSNLTIVDIDGDEGKESLSKLNLPKTLTVHTSKGMHLYYKYEANAAIRNSVRLLPGIDIRTQGGYVVSPFSTHKSGAEYKYEDASAEILYLPQAIIDICVKAQEGKEKKEAIDITSIREGSRNTTLTSLAGSLHNILRDRDLVLKNVMTMNDSFSEPLPASEVEKIVDSVCRYTRDLPMRKLTDMGVVERFIDMYSDTICFNINSGNWMIYDGKVWKNHETDNKSFLCKTIIDKVVAIVRNIPKEVAEDSEYYEAYEKFSRQCEAAGKLKSIISLAASKLGRSAADFDNNDHVFNCDNATLVLTKGKVTVKQHSRNDFLSKMSQIKYDAAAKCPTWDAFLARIFNNDQDLIQYIQRAVGYTMTGSTKEQVFFTLFGSGANGKSVFLDTLRYIMGEYGQQSDFSTFLTKKNDTGARNDIACMVGARFICASESGVFKTIDDALIKDVTGGKTIRARFLHKEFFEFTPQMKIFLATNHKPNIHDDSNGMWRRVRLIPFTVTIPAEERDKNLYDKLLSEASGILNWCISGFEAWSTNGLGTCTSVECATESYKTEMDTLGVFMDECIKIGKDLTTKSSTLYSTYVEWAEENGERVLSNKMFSIKIADRGYNKIKTRDGMYWQGLDVVSEF